MSRIQPPDCSKLEKKKKNNEDVTIYQHYIIYLLIKLFFTDEFTPSEHTFSTNDMAPYKNSVSNKVSEFISMNLG